MMDLGLYNTTGRTPIIIWYNMRFIAKTALKPPKKPLFAKNGQKRGFWAKNRFLHKLTSALYIIGAGGPFFEAAGMMG